MSTISISSSCFHLFPNLPLKLRLKIWKTIASSPRIVIIRSTPASEFTSLPGHGFTSTTPIPPILHVSAEARSVGLPNYTLCSPAHAEKGVFGRAAKIYFNFGGGEKGEGDMVDYTEIVRMGSVEGWERGCVHEWGGGYFLKERKGTRFSALGVTPRATALCCPCGK
jgi:hypothetical protein